MVVKRRLRLAVAAALTLAMTAAVPVLGGYGPANPDPLAQEELLRVQDIAATGKTRNSGPVVAVGWRQAAKPGELFVTYSTDGGSSYLKKNGQLRSFRVAGDGTRGLSLDSCAGSIWVASVANYPGDDTADRDVFLTSRTVNGKPGQVYLTDAASSRKARSVSVSCVGKKLLAIAWLEQSFGKPRAKLMLRSLEAAGQPTSFRKVYGLGEADLKGGISVDASTDSVHVAWTTGSGKALRYQRFLVAEGKPPAITRQPAVRLAAKDVQLPQVASRGQKVVVAYSDAGKIKARVSGDDGETFDEPALVVSTGSQEGALTRALRRCQRSPHRRRGLSQPGWPDHPAARPVGRPGSDLAEQLLRACRGSGRGAAQDEPDQLGAGRSLAEQRAGPGHAARPDRALVASGSRLERCSPAIFRHSGSETRPDSRFRPGLRGRVMAPSLAELTSAAYLAITPRR